MARGGFSLPVLKGVPARGLSRVYERATRPPLTTPTHLAQQGQHEELRPFTRKLTWDKGRRGRLGMQEAHSERSN